MPPAIELRSERKRRLHQLLLIEKGVITLKEYITQTKIEMEAEDVAYVLQQMQDAESKKQSLG